MQHLVSQSIYGLLVALELPVALKTLQAALLMSKKGLLCQSVHTKSVIALHILPSQLHGKF